MENKIENKNYTITIKFEDIDFNRVSWFMSDCANEEDPELNLKELFEGEISDCLNHFLIQDKYVVPFAGGFKGGAYLPE